jgi:hypothetical protein
VYQAGRGPIDVTIYDPMAVKAGGFQLAFNGITDDSYWFLSKTPVNNVSVSNILDDGSTWKITTASPLGVATGQYIYLSDIQGFLPSLNGWHLVEGSFGTDIWIPKQGENGAFVSGTGSARFAVERSTYSIVSINQQLYEPNKIAISASKINGQEPGQYGAPENGFLEATITYADPNKVWLTGITDVDASTKSDPNNWILSGTTTNVDMIQSGIYLDSNEVYEGVLGGTWAPYILANNTNIDGAPKVNDIPTQSVLKYTNLHSVDIVLTNDKSKWTRCVVMELGMSGNVNGAAKFSRRNQSSVDKEGNPWWNSPNVAEASLTDTVGMGWFPGYALNVETGDRLNIMFGENSSLVNENSRDMLWNPTGNTGNDANGKLAFGGMHYIYILNRDTLATGIQNYDEGARPDSILKLASATGRRPLHRAVSWVSLPIAATGYSTGDSSNISIPTETKIRIRVKKNYRQYISEAASPVNGGNPLYEFEIPGSKEPSRGVSSVGSKALDLIRVVPNPYYAYSSYERTRNDQLDNRVRITNLPSKCTVSIYTLNGTLIRQFKRDVAGDVSSGLAVSEGRDDNQATTLDWDLKNTAGITVASGIYIFHVDAGDLGEHVVKWFGIMRPIDLDSF